MAGTGGHDSVDSLLGRPSHSGLRKKLARNFTVADGALRGVDAGFTLRSRLRR